MPESSGIAYSRRALAYLHTLQPDRRRLIVGKIRNLTENPRPTGAALVKGGKDERVFRIRSGAYRILYALRGAEIFVVRIGHRKDVYK